jgi:hypothetical protein
MLDECLVEVGWIGASTFTKTKVNKLQSLGLDVDSSQEGLNTSSPQQVVALLKALGYVVSDSSEETLTSLAESSVVAQAILELRSGYSLMTSVAKPSDKDGRFRTSINLHVTETTRLSSTKSHYGGGCMLPEVEILTPHGWTEFQDLDASTTALVWSDNSNSLFFETCPVVKFDYNGVLDGAFSNFHRSLYTPDHTIPTMTTRLGHLTTYKASELCTKDALRIPISSYYHSGTEELPAIRLIVAAMADGDIQYTRDLLRFQLKKERKIERLFYLASTLDCNITEQKGSRSDLRRFVVSGDAAAQALDYCRAHNKHFQMDFINLTASTLEAIIDELRFWDSHSRNRSYIFSTVRGQLAEQVCTIAHLTANSASFSINYDNNRGYGSGNNKPLYIINIKPRWYAVSDSKHWFKQEYKGDVYCLTTTTGFFMVRSQGRIMITGNSNMQNVTRKARPLFCGGEE